MESMKGMRLNEIVVRIHKFTELRLYKVQPLVVLILEALFLLKNSIH